MLRIWDPRTGRKEGKMKGHKENIKGIVTNRDGTLVLSASSDRTIKLWDVGTRKCITSYNNDAFDEGDDGGYVTRHRCIKTYEDIHSDSVWSLAADSSFSYFISAGRDGRVIKTYLSPPSYSSPHQLVCQQKDSVLKVLLDEKQDVVWVTTTSPTISAWVCYSSLFSSPFLGNQIATLLTFISESFRLDKIRIVVIAIVIASSVTILIVFVLNYLIDLTNFSNRQEEVNAIDEKKVAEITGRAGIINHHILNNRRHVLTQDNASHIQLWDVTTVNNSSYIHFFFLKKKLHFVQLFDHKKPQQGRLVEDYGKCSQGFEKKVEELFEMVSIPNWFSIDIKTGVKMSITHSVLSSFSNMKQNKQTSQLQYIWFRVTCSTQKCLLRTFQRFLILLR